MSVSSVRASLLSISSIADHKLMAAMKTSCARPRSPSATRARLAAASRRCGATAWRAFDGIGTEFKNARLDFCSENTSHSRRSSKCSGMGGNCESSASGYVYSLSDLYIVRIEADVQLLELPNDSPSCLDLYASGSSSRGHLRWQAILS